MNAEVARRRPAEVLEARPLPRPVTRLVAVERTVPRPPAPHGTPADWPWYVWVPLLCGQGVLLAAMLIGLIYALC